MTGPVIIVDDHRLLSQTLGMALHAAGFDPIAVDPHEDVVRRVRESRASVVLLDLNLGQVGSGNPGEGSDAGALRGEGLIADLAQHCAVVVLTAETDQARWGACLLNGAAGVLPKSVPLALVIQAVTAAAHGLDVGDVADRQRWMRAADRRRAQTDQQLAVFGRLTAREQEVLAAMVDGERATDIAARITVSEATVRSHIRSVLHKLGVGSQLQAVARARRAGWPARHADGREIRGD